MPKYPKENYAILDSDLYSQVFEKKGVKFLRIRRTKDFSKLVGEELEILVEHVWSANDSLAKLSIRYYNSIQQWWVIGLANGKPTDGHYSIGDIVYIPRYPNYIEEKMR